LLALGVGPLGSGGDGKAQQQVVKGLALLGV
jgi:hypothetical protein